MARLVFDELELPPIVNRVQGPQYEEFKRTLLALLFTQRARTFDKQEGPDGPWEPLKDNQEIVRFRKLKDGRKKAVKSLRKKAIASGDIKILQDDRVLLQSFTIEGAPQQETSTRGDEVQMGTNVEYAAAHNFGVTFQHPGTQNGFGQGIVIDPYNITIPRRQFDHFSAQDIQEIEELTNSYLNEPKGAFE